MCKITGCLSAYVVFRLIGLSVAAIYTYEDVELRRIFPNEFPQDVVRKSGSLDPEHLGRYMELKHYFKYPKTRLNSHFEELVCYEEGGKKVCKPKFTREFDSLIESERTKRKLFLADESTIQFSKRPRIKQAKNLSKVTNSRRKKYSKKLNRPEKIKKEKRRKSTTSKKRKHAKNHICSLEDLSLHISDHNSIENSIKVKPLRKKRQVDKRSSETVSMTSDEYYSEEDSDNIEIFNSNEIATTALNSSFTIKDDTEGKQKGYGEHSDLTIEKLSTRKLVFKPINISEEDNNLTYNVTNKRRTKRRKKGKKFRIVRKKKQGAKVSSDFYINNNIIEP